MKWKTFSLLSELPDCFNGNPLVCKTVDGRYILTHMISVYPRELRDPFYDRNNTSLSVSLEDSDYCLEATSLTPCSMCGEYPAPVEIVAWLELE